MKLNLGSGASELDGYENLDRKNGQEIYPLSFADSSAEEIYASHVLEHFSHREISNVLKEWVRVLKPGGVLRIAVPDFDKIIAWYKAERNDLPLHSYLMGGQMDENDFHKAVFNRESLKADLEAAGLVDVSEWEAISTDCASLPVSLNLQGIKPIEQVEIIDSPIKIHAVASVPRLGFNATWHCTITALNALGIDMTMVEGAFWGQCLTRGLEMAIATGSEYIVTIDYDSVFSAAQLHRLCQLIIEHPEYDAIIPVQIKRENDSALFKLNGDRDFNKALTSVASGHFGLSIFKASSFSQLSKPWFHSQPNEQGEWGEGRLDDDIAFWKNFGLSGCKVALANEVRIGHLELGITWPGDGFVPVRQSISEYREQGQPGGGLKVQLIS
jgi:predicted SAM-dependent methyltransferase